MNLGKLLVAGKSVINGRGEISYRANKHVYLPKFGTTQQSFQAPAATAAATPAPERIAAPAAPALTAPAVPAVAPVATKTQKIPALASAPVRPASWAGKLNPISIWRGAPPVAKPTQPAVQTELSLDSVKVVHNDLSDADVEVVPMKSRTAGESVPDLPPPTKSWEFLAERLFHVASD